VNIVRKISVGPDYMKCMHYVVGQEVLGKSYTIDSIIQEDSSISIYIRRDDEIVKWKEFSSTMPVSIEFKIDF
jgi:hypothetical protein|tara:strand:+ start:4118 stop:4336 length:219 start_codon:yes stop_codon:yes gene_type:complete